MNKISQKLLLSVRWHFVVYDDDDEFEGESLYYQRAVQYEETLEAMGT